MNCEFDHELLSLYADGALKRERVPDVENHISECEDCRRALEVMQDLGKVLNSLPRESAPQALIERILTEAEDKVRLTAWEAIRRTVSAIWIVAINGFGIEDDREGLLRRELPGWVVRWVLFV